MRDNVSDEALIRNTVIGLNFVDVYYRRGSLPVPAFPAIIGDEAAGVVEAVGRLDWQIIGTGDFRSAYRVLIKFAAYYNECRIHRSLNKDAPFHRVIERLGAITTRPVLGGLHHQYCRT